MRLKFILRTGPYSFENVDTVYNLSKRALAKGHDVFIFLYEEGTLNADADIKSLEERNIADRLRELIQLGAKIGICGTCAKFRGQTRKDVIEGAKFGGLALLVKEMPVCDRLFTFGY